MFQKHGNRELAELFASKPYQGAEPERSRFLFIGLDANYAADIEHNPIFPCLLRYHADGPAFWREASVHHPFLLPAYSGDGKRYHRTFAKIGFTSEHADQVSFMELLHLPTVGRNRLEPVDLDVLHLRRLRAAIFQGGAEYIFVPAGVLRLMRSTSFFNELSSRPRPTDSLQILFDDGVRQVFQHLHFSNYGKFESRLQAEARAIAALIPPRLIPRALNPGRAHRA